MVDIDPGASKRFSKLKAEISLNFEINDSY
jgi:hypothetical protein